MKIITTKKLMMMVDDIKDGNYILDCNDIDYDNKIYNNDNDDDDSDNNSVIHRDNDNNNHH